jgi:hypothetical protein
VVSPLAFLLQNSFLETSLGNDVVSFLLNGQPTLISLKVCMLKRPHTCTSYRSHHCNLYNLPSYKFLLLSKLWDTTDVQILCYFPAIICDDVTLQNICICTEFQPLWLINHLQCLDSVQANSE